MSVNSAMLEAMKAEGLDLDACIRIIKAGEKKADPTNAERQARFRAKRRDGGSSNAVTVTPVTPPNERDNLTPPRKEKPKAKALVKKRMPIPDDWQPAPFSIGSESRKVVDSWPPGEEAAQLEQMKAHHRSKHNTFIDPQDAWSNWVLNTRKWGIGRDGRTSGMGRHQPDGLSSTARAALAVFGPP